MVETLTDRLTEAWARTDRIFEILAPGSWLAQPIALRHPFIFYLGHLPAFAWNHVGGELLGRPAFNPAFDELFSRGIDPDVDDPTHCHDHPEVPATWPAVPEVLAYRDRVRAALLDASAAVADRAATHLMAGEGRVYAMIAEHELMHQETLLYMMQRLPLEQKVRPSWVPPLVLGPGRPADKIAIPAGSVTLGARFDDLPFGWDNEFAALEVPVPAFRIDGTAVTNAQFLAFVEDGGYRRPDLWSDEDRVWLGHAAIEHPVVWELPRRALDVPDPLRARAARRGGGLAGLREPRGGAGLRAMARRAAAHRGRVPARRLRPARRRLAPLAVGRRAARPSATGTSATATGRRRRWARIPRARAPGACRT